MLLPLLALVFIVGRHLFGGSMSMIWLFGILIVLAGVAMVEIVRSIRAAGYV